LPRIKQRSATTADEAAGLNQHVKLENRLVLLAWLNSLLGYENNKDLLTDFKNIAEGFDASGRSYLYYHLISRGSKVNIRDEDLERYDENICAHLAAINRGRVVPVILRYFQHLAALYSEIFLDRYFNHRAQMLADLNALVHKRNVDKVIGEALDEKFTESDLSKLVFWMATGSGKTLILHLNYYQFLHYTTEKPDNILLITPNKGLSEQHLAELAISGISARRFSLASGRLTAGVENIVQVIEITKLVEEKRGGGVSVPVEAFEGRNLIFVDEGHKGSGGEAWRGYREGLGETGFTFEYSATFGQALSVARNDPLTAEYGKAIVFDYSYRYFYGDGYGKDFRILNIQEDSREEDTKMLLLGNLLSFYEQQQVFKEQADGLRPYNLEKPLWVFVGSTVNAVYTRNKKKCSDVLTVVRFLHHVLENKGGWVLKGIEKLLEGKSGLVTSDDMDIFAGRFSFLRNTGFSAQTLYVDILESVFHSPVGGGLHLCDIRGNDGELGLKAGSADDYFGLIYIGDTSEFKKLVENDQTGIVLEEDAISGSLFERINQRDSRANILIGAKKFMEGWNSWRVSNMGLLNIGRKEGSQIIQLFGRGVRLRGKGYSLKRSAVIEGKHPPGVRLLETLNIFAVRANYMAQFRDYLEREGVETEGSIELPLSISTNERFLKRGLIVPSLPEGWDFVQKTDLLLEVDPYVQVTVDMSVKVQTIESSAAGLKTTDVRSGVVHDTIPPKSFSLVDWEQVYLDLLIFKERKGLKNLVIRPETPRSIIVEGNYTIRADKSVVEPRSFAECALLQEAVVCIVCKYADSFYRHKREKLEKQHLVYKTLDKEDSNLTFNREAVRDRTDGTYVVKIRKSETKLIEAIEQLRKDVDLLYKRETNELPRLYFDRHLYLPLLLKRSDNLSSIPSGLEESEAEFVGDLKDYWEKEKDESLNKKEVFLLRNLSRGKGIGFFENSGFYPDFILWVIDRTGQRIVFIEPHGMLHAKAYIYDEKAQLHERLPGLAEEIGERSRKKNITLDSFIISATPYDDLYKRYDDGTWDRARFAEMHILFPERNDKYDYIKAIFETIS
jgi:hypothetical protein